MTKPFGIRYAKGCDPIDIGSTYFSSSKIVKRLISEDGLDSFKFEVRKVFDSKEAAIKWETKFLTRIDAANSDMWLNRHNSNGNYNWQNKGGYKLTEVTKQKMRKPKGEKHREKLAKHLRKVNFQPEWTEERRKRQSERMKGHSWNKGKPKSEETKKKISEALKGKPGTTNGMRWKVSHTLKICPHCGKEGKGPNMTRYHFDNCKLRT